MKSSDIKNIDGHEEAEQLHVRLFDLLKDVMEAQDNDLIDEFGEEIIVSDQDFPNMRAVNVTESGIVVTMLSGTKVTLSIET